MTPSKKMHVIYSDLHVAQTLLPTYASSYVLFMYFYVFIKKIQLSVSGLFGSSTELLWMNNQIQQWQDNNIAVLRSTWIPQFRQISRGTHDQPEI